MLMEVRDDADVDTAVWVQENIGDFWLGGSDIDTEGSWVWASDGAPINMTRYWASGEPSDSVGIQNCAAPTVSGMRDVFCGGYLAFICV